MLWRVEKWLILLKAIRARAVSDAAKYKRLNGVTTLDKYGLLDCDPWQEWKASRVRNVMRNMHKILSECNRGSNMESGIKDECE